MCSKLQDWHLQQRCSRSCWNQSIRQKASSNLSTIVVLLDRWLWRSGPFPSLAWSGRVIWSSCSSNVQLIQGKRCEDCIAHMRFWGADIAWAQLGSSTSVSDCFLQWMSARAEKLLSIFFGSAVIGNRQVSPCSKFRRSAHTLNVSRLPAPLCSLD